MRKTITYISLMLALKIHAIEQKSLDSFCTFESPIAQLSLLTGNGKTVFDSTADIKLTIQDWKKDNFRKKALNLLECKSVNIRKSNKMVVIEWGGDGVPYSALFFLKAIYFIKDNGAGDMLIEKIEKTAEMKEVFKNVDMLINIVEKSKYKGDISGDGEDILTYIITILHGDEDKSVIIYEAAIPDIEENNDRTGNKKLTIMIWEFIIKIKKICNINLDSGA